MEYGTVLAWHKQAGDPVEAGEPILELEADKVSFEIESPATGTLAAIVAVAGDELRVGGLLAIIDADERRET
jgi:pyruvate/2-oxoglutarate dehydrogenase complex dihydrolipoamide acyltransferase (E2) component